MSVFAHRGFSGLYPENTMVAFEKANEVGSDGIELDVHLTRDGEVMIIHDESLLRTAGLDKNISELTRGEAERISAGKTQNDRFGFTPLPSLEEYLSWVKKTKLITNIELKTAPMSYVGLEEKVFSMVSSFGLEDRVIYSSFNWLSVVRIRQLSKRAKCGFLIAQPRINHIVNLIGETGFDYYHPDYRLLSDDVIEESRKAGVGINAWTVNSDEAIAECLRWGIDGIISNYPDRVLALKALPHTNA